MKLSSADSHLSRATTLRIFLPFGFGYFFSFLFRSVNAVIAPDLVRELGVSATDLGLLTSVYFLTFGSFQFPLGMLLDRYGPRRIGTALLFTAAIGAYIFGSGESLFALVLGRALIGLGFSSALMSAYKANTIWFPKEKLARMGGITLTFGGIGALASTSPVAAMLQVMSWRGVFYFLGALTVLVALSIFIFAPKEEQNSSGESFSEQLAGTRQILCSRDFWRYTPLVSLTFAAFLSLQGLWAGAWLRDIAHVSRSAVATHLLVVAAAMTAGFFIFGWLTDALRERGIAETTVVAAGTAVFLIMQLLFCFGFTRWTYLTWAIFGFAGTSAVVGYPILSGIFPPHLAGRVNTTLNFFLFAASFSAQYAMGAIIDLWPPAPGGGYDPRAYPAAIGLMIAFQLAALIWFIRPARRK
ncbi:MAG: MFS transporter [bacterium]|nr:MFS transporter [bacterium]